MQRSQDGKRCYRNLDRFQPVPSHQKCRTNNPNDRPWDRDPIRNRPLVKIDESRNRQQSQKDRVGDELMNVQALVPKQRRHRLASGSVSIQRKKEPRDNQLDQKRSHPKPSAKNALIVASPGTKQPSNGR